MAERGLTIDAPPTTRSGGAPIRHGLASILAVCALLVLTLVATGRLIGDDFVGFDDPTTIANNPAFNPPTIRSIAHYWVAPAEALYAPVTYTTWGLLAGVARVDQADETGSHLNPWVYHAANVWIHCMTVLLVWSVLRPTCGSRFSAFVGAAVFGVHPVQVEPIAWASGTKDLLAGLFIVLTVRQALSAHRSASRIAILAAVCTLLACLS
jgi:hypothetical protein